MRTNAFYRNYDLLAGKLGDASYGPRDVTIDGTKTSVLTGKTWTGTLHLDADGVDLLQ